ncbi:UNVERIFIED_CONTAM: Transcription factor HHO2 [Sesamum latifolium]|uniref:Transcription factor HHO2 n=1 Tax=Sesamum latifolium TaxID=2727402 RepID=A0AAW2YCS9_9LAMI
MQRCQDYIHALEEERRKIQVFQRELPLCLELVTQDINPSFRGVYPIKRASSHSDGEEQESKKPKNESNAANKDGKNGNDKNSKKSDWLRSVQLWNQTPDPPSKEDSPRKVAVVEVKRNGGGGAFHPFKKEKSTAGGDGTATPPPQGPVNRPLPPASTSSTEETGGGSGGGNKKEAKEGQSQRKARRCWSPELHRRFLQALQQLGGSHVATPKQIRELMKVDGLTNDEVKSHLQKYRLHTRRPNPSIHNNNNNNAQTPQFVVVGGIWVPPEYAAMATTSTSGEAAGVAASKGIYTPIAAPPPHFQESPASSKQHKTCSHSDDRGSNSTEGGVQSCTRSTSSSTHTATA